MALDVYSATEVTALDGGLPRFLRNLVDHDEPVVLTVQQKGVALLVPLEDWEFPIALGEVIEALRHRAYQLAITEENTL